MYGLAETRGPFTMMKQKCGGKRSEHGDGEKGDRIGA